MLKRTHCFRAQKFTQQKTCFEKRKKLNEKKNSLEIKKYKFDVRWLSSKRVDAGLTRT